MPAKKDFSQDANNIFPVDVTKKPAEQPVNRPADVPAPKIKAKERQSQVQSNSGGDLIRRTYYITEDIYKALKIKAACSNNPEEKDQSAIVRAALRQYLEL